jgi:hypothetical protein
LLFIKKKVHHSATVSGREGKEHARFESTQAFGLNRLSS